MDPCGAPPRRRKSAAERRAQRRRAEARVAQRLLQAFASLSSHRGGECSALGAAFAAALRIRGDGVRPPPDAAGTSEAHGTNESADGLSAAVPVLGPVVGPALLVREAQVSVQPIVMPMEETLVDGQSTSRSTLQPMSAAQEIADEAAAAVDVSSPKRARTDAPSADSAVQADERLREDALVARLVAEVAGTSEGVCQGRVASYGVGCSTLPRGGSARRTQVELPVSVFHVFFM